MADDKKGASDTQLETLVKYFEDYLDATVDARKWAERDRDYYDNKQLTADEIKELKDRGQPPIIINRIGEKIDYYLGLERQSRTDPKAYPRTPMDEDGANAATDAIRFVCDRERYPRTRSEMFENILIEGTGAGIVEVKEYGKRREICIKRIPWDRFFYDPRSVERDFSDARYKGIVVWLDVDDAKAKYPKANIDTIYESSVETDSGDTTADRPRHVWSDSKRKRLRLCEIYFKEGGKWKYAVFTKAGFAMEPQASSYMDDENEPCCPIEAHSCYVDRDNGRYGGVRRYIGPQDEINKRRSKALHLLVTRQTIGERGAVNNIQAMKREKNRPDGHIEFNPGMKFEFADNAQQVQQNLEMLQEAKNEIDVMGANAALSGKTSKDSSGRALEARQQGGLVQIGPVMDTIKQLNQAIYRQVWARIKQFWTDEVWVRVTDDDKNVRFSGLNTIATDEMGQPVIGPDGQPQIMNNTAQLDVDINLDDSVDTTSLRSEQFQMLAEMYKANPQNAANPGGMPFEFVIEASELRNKDKILEAIKGGGQQGQQQDPAVAQHAQGMMAAEQAGAAADVQARQAKAAQEAAKVGQIQAQTEGEQAKTQKTLVETVNAAQQPERDQERFEAQQDARQQARPPE